MGQDQGLWRRLRQDPELSHFLSKQQLTNQQMWLGAQGWSVLLANILLDAAGAEVAMVWRPGHLSSTSPGPMLETYVQRWLPDDARILVFELDGTVLKRLEQALRDSSAPVTVSGLVNNPLRVSGRALVAKERYTVTMSSLVLSLPVVSRALRGQPPNRRFEMDPQGYIRASAKGPQLLVREVALARLRSLRQLNPDFGPAYRALLRSWLVPQGSQVTPRWSLSVEGLSISYTGYSNHPSRAWLSPPKGAPVCPGAGEFPGHRAARAARGWTVQKRLQPSPGAKGRGAFWPGSSWGCPLWRAKLQLGSTLRYFPDTDQDTVEDLGLIWESNARLQVPFTRDLSLALMADVFFYVPKLETYQVQTEEALQAQVFGQEIQRGPALSSILSAGLSFDRLWKF